MAAETAELVWRGGRHVEARIRDLTVHHDKPRERGGTDRGPMPSEMFLATLASCTMMSALRVAEVRKVPVQGMSATCGLEYDAQDKVRRIQLEVRVQSPAGREDWDVVARMAGRFCTIEQLTKPPVDKVFVLNGTERIASEKAE